VKFTMEFGIEVSEPYAMRKGEQPRRNHLTFTLLPCLDGQKVRIFLDLSRAHHGRGIKTSHGPRLHEFRWWQRFVVKIVRCAPDRDSWNIWVYTRNGAYDASFVVSKGLTS